MNSIQVWHTGLGAALAAVMFLGTAQAEEPILQDGLYRLNNHPSGNQAPPPYGLRLDELVDLSNQHDRFTFDFNHPQADMYASLSGQTLDIFGVVYGGHDIGTDYNPDYQGLWSVHFRYTNLEQHPSDDDLIAWESQSSGYIEQLFSTAQVQSGTRFELFDYAGMHNYTFRLGDKGNDNGHRGFNGISGWGWLTYPNGHTKSSDFLFTVDPVVVPEASTYAMLGLLLAFVALLRSRQQKAASQKIQA